MLEQFIEWLINNWNDVTIGILLVVIIYGGSRPEPWWVFGREFNDERSDKEEWKQLALDSTGLATKATDVADAAVKKAEE